MESPSARSQCFPVDGHGGHGLRGPDRLSKRLRWNSFQERTLSSRPERSRPERVDEASATVVLACGGRFPAGSGRRGACNAAAGAPFGVSTEARPRGGSTLATSDAFRRLKSISRKSASVHRVHLVVTRIDDLGRARGVGVPHDKHSGQMPI